MINMLLTVWEKFLTLVSVLIMFLVLFIVIGSAVGCVIYWFDFWDVLLKSVVGFAKNT